MSAVAGSAIVSKMEDLGKAALGYSETTDGGTGPQYYDCSGLVQKTLTDLGISGVPRTSEAQWAWLQSAGTATKGAPKSVSDLSVGDLVFANFGNEVSPGHVGIYVGNGQVYSAQDQSAGIGTASLASWESSGTIVGYASVPGSTTSASTSSSSGGVLGDLGFLSSMATTASDILHDMDEAASVAVWLANPGHWLRIGAFFMGIVLLGLGIHVMREGK
jgi:hypothetical protein